MIDGMNASISLRIDIEKSVEATKEGIAELQRRLDAAGVKIKLKAELDKNIQQSIKNLGTTGAKAATDSGKKIGEALGNSLINQYNIKNKQAQNQIKNLTNMLQNVSIGELQTGKENPKYLEYINQLGEVISKNAQIIQSRTGIYDNFFNYFKSLDRIKIPDIVKSDLGKEWNSLRMVSADKFITDPNKSGIQLDSIYQEMSSKFKDMFSGTADPTQQFREIVNAIKLYKADVDKMEPVNLKDKIGYEDDMYIQLYADLTVMRTQLKAQLESINGDVSAEAQNIKKSLLDIDVSFDKGTISELTSQVKGYFTQLEGITDKDIKLQFLKGENEDVTAFNATLDKGRGIIEKYSFAMNEMGQYVYSGGNIIDKSGKEFAEVSAKATEFQSKLENLKSTYKSFLSGDSTNNSFKSLVDSIDFSNISDKGSLDAMIAKYDQAIEKAKSFNAEIAKKWSSNAAEKLDQYIRELPADIDYLESKFKGAKFDMPDDVAQAFHTMRQQLQQIGSIDEPEGKIKLYNQLTESLNTCTQRYKQMAIEQKNAAKNTKLNADKSLFGTNLDTWMNKNTDAAKVFSSRLAQIKADLQSADSVKFTTLQNEFKQIQSEAKQLGLTTNATVQEMKSAFDSAVANVVSLTAAFQTFKQMVNTAKDIDTALYNIEVATGQMRDQAKSLIETYNQMAQEFGTSTVAITQSADDWLRSGKSISETNQLIKDSFILSRVGMLDTAKATEDLLSVLNGYKMDISDTLSIVSRLTNLDMASAISAGALAEALSRTAASAEQAGVNLDLLLGMLAAIKDTAPSLGDENIGNAMKSVIARYEQIKVGKFVDYESGDDLSNVEKTLGKIGIKIRENLTDYRDLSDVLRELAARYGSLNDVERNSVNTALFGTYQANIGQVLMTNWDKVENLAKISANSTDEALKKFEAYSDTVEAHINSMTAAGEKLSMQIVDSEFLKGAADSGTVFLNVLSDVIDKLGVLSTAMGAITAGGALRGKTIGVFNNNGSEITFLGKTLEEMRQASAEGEKFGGLFTKNVVQPIANADSIISNYNVLVKAQCANQKAINQLTNDFDMRSYLSGLNGAEATMKGYTASLNASKTATMALKLETVALNMALNMGITAAITAGIWAIGKAYDYVAHNVDNLKEKAEESAQAYDDAKNEVESLNDELKTTNSRIDDLEAKDHLSFIEQEELQKLKDANAELERSIQLAEIKADTAGKQSRADALKALGAESYYGSYDGVDLDKTSIYEGYQNIGTISGGRGTVMENATKQLADYNRYLEERKKIEQQIADIEQKNPTGYQDQADYAMLTNAKKQYDSWILEAENALSEMSGNLTNFKKSLDPSQDAELISSINSFLDGYMQDYQNTAENVTEAFDKVWNSANFSKQKAVLEDMAKSGELDASVLSSNERYKRLLDATGKSAQEVCDQIYTLTDAEKEEATAGGTSKAEQIASINELSEGFEELDKIMKSIKDKDPFDYSLLDDKKFKDTFSGLDKDYEDFVEKISASPNDIKACESAFNDLITAWLNSTDICKNLTDDNAALTTSMLSNMGVANAEEIVTDALAKKHDELAAQKYYDANASDTLRNATVAEYNEFLNEANLSDTAKVALAQLELQKIAVNNVKIDTASDIDQIINLANAAGAGAEALAKVARAKAVYAKAESTGLTSAGDFRQLEEADKVLGDISSGTYDWSFKIDANQFKSSVYGGGVKTNKQSGSGNKSKSTKDPTEFDWLERKLKLIDDQITKTKDNISELVGFKLQNAETDTAIDMMQSKIDVLQQMTDKYMESAKAIGLSADYIEKIQNGAIDIDKIGDETLAKNIKEYQSLYDKAKDCTDQIESTKKEIESLNRSKLDNIISQYQTMNDTISGIIDSQEKMIDLRSQSGDEVFADDYIDLAQQQLQLTRQNTDAYNALKSEMDKMDLKEGSDDWKKYNDQLLAYKNNMISAAKAVEDYKDSMTDLVYKTLDDYKNKMNSINSTISVMADLLGDNNLVDDTGELTDIGLAKVGLYAQQLVNAKQETAEYAKAMESLNEALDSGLITQDEYNDRMSDYRSSQESAVQATKEARDAILSLAKEGIQAEIDAKKKLTEETINALEAEKDLHDYTESINEKQKNITTLQKKIAALAGATSGAELAQRIQLQKDLADAQKDLYDTQYDHNLEQQKQKLNEEADAYEEAKNKEMNELENNLDTQEKYIQKYLNKVKTNYNTVYDTITTYGNKYNLAATEDLTEPWGSGSDAANTCADAIGDAIANINYEISSLDFTPLQELIDMLNSLGEYGMGDAGGSSQFEDISDEGTWHKGSGGRWWFGEDDDNYAQDGVYTINGKQYGFGKDGYMFTGWNDESGDWRYFDPDDGGAMAKSCWKQDGKGKWFYLDKSGAMVTDAAVKSKENDGYYYVDDDGKWDGETLTYAEVKRRGLKIGYKKGTRSATPGLHPVDEEGRGSELMIAKNGTILNSPSGGEVVFTKEMTDKLFDFSKNPDMFVENLKKQSIPDIPMINNTMTQQITVPINIAGNADMNTINAIKEMLPKEMKKYATGKMFTDIKRASTNWHSHVYGKYK